MRKIFLVCTSDFYYKNIIFDLDSPFNRDNAWYPHYLLKKCLFERGVEINTIDYLSTSDNNIELLFYDIPSNIDCFVEKYKNIPMYLLMAENGLIVKDNFDLKKHKYFKKIFTYRDDWIDNIKYFKINYSFKLPTNIDMDIEKKEKLCVLIAWNKTSHHALELYSKRIEAIRWFENNHPEDLDLYGIGWDEYFFSGPKIIRILNKSRYLREIFAPHYCSYKGKIERKKDVLGKYKFSICYENFRDIPGWITEKIFDCFFAGCVPIYWGADNVTDHIPSDCFIDKRKYHNYDELYSYIRNMKDEEYLNYLNNIERYLNSDKAHEFSVEYFVDTIFENIIRANK